MLKFAIETVVFVLSVICYVHAKSNIKFTASQTNPEHPNKCWDGGAQIAYSVGSHNSKDSCQRIHCYPDFRMKFTSCGTHSEVQGYTIEQDFSKDYPECCAKLVKMEKSAKRFDHIDAPAVKITKFKGRERFGARTVAVDVQKEQEKAKEKELEKEKETEREKETEKENEMERLMEKEKEAEKMKEKEVSSSAAISEENEETTTQPLES